MIVSRATFLKALGLAGLGTCLDHAAPSVAAASAAADVGRVSQGPIGGPISIGHVTAAHFRTHVGEAFAVRSSANEQHVLVLAEVAECSVSRGVEQFSLIFHGAPGFRLADGTHTFSHSQLGSLDIFIAPIGPTNRLRADYEACFSRCAAASDHRRT